MPQLIPVILIVIVLYLIFRKPKKPVIDQNLSKEYSDLAYQLLQSNPAINAIRADYHKNKVKATVGWVIIIVSLLGTAASVILLAGVVAGFILLETAKSNVKKLSETQFDTIWKPMISAIPGYTLEYSHHDGISQSDYNHGSFELYEYLKSEDLVKGTVYGHPFICSDVRACCESNDGEGGTSEYTIFRGAFAKIDLNTNIKGAVKIYNRKTRNTSDDLKVTINDSAFSDKYVVYSTNPDIATKALTPSVTQHILNTYLETGIQNDIIIEDKAIYVRMHTNMDMYAVSFSSPALEARTVGNNIAILLNMIKIMEVITNEIEKSFY